MGIGVLVGVLVGIWVGVSVGACAVRVALLTRAIAALVAATSGVGVGVGPHAVNNERATTISKLDLSIPIPPIASRNEFVAGGRAMIIP